MKHIGNIKEIHFKLKYIPFGNLLIFLVNSCNRYSSRI